MSKCVLNIVCAFETEARVLIKLLKLKKITQGHKLPIYRNEKNGHYLILSGMGKVNSAIATTYLASLHTDKEQAFLNLGIAGAKSKNLGELYVASKIEEADTKHTYYAKVNFLKGQAVENLVTHTQPVEHFPSEAMVDMEASGFYQAALNFTTQELIQVVKVISDNQHSTYKAFNKEDNEKYMFENGELIVLIIDKIKKLLNTIEGDKVKELYSLLQKNHYFTTQEAMQLHRLLQKAYVFNLELGTLHHLKSGKAILSHLRLKLEDCY